MGMQELAKGCFQINAKHGNSAMFFSSIDVHDASKSLGLISTLGTSNSHTPLTLTPQQSEATKIKILINFLFFNYGAFFGCFFVQLLKGITEEYYKTYYCKKMKM